MRHDALAREDYAKVDVAAVWPVGTQVAPLPALDLEAPAAAEAFQPTPSSAEVPAAVGKLIVAAYAGLILALALVTIGSGYSLFMITISALFVVMFFAVPRLILGTEPGDKARPSFDRFMRQGMNTLTGPSTGGATLVQMLIVPVALTIGILLIGTCVSILG